MNSWKSTELSACAPPFKTFIIGTGSTDGAPVAGELGDVRVERLAGVGGGSAGRGERDAQDRVRSQPRLVRGAVQIDHRPVERLLIGRVGAAKRVGDLAVDVRDRL